ncbi:MAG: hypothetical protein QXJ51_06595 [Sulfolobales archaeon]
MIIEGGVNKIRICSSSRAAGIYNMKRDEEESHVSRLEYEKNLSPIKDDSGDLDFRD